MRSRCKGAAMKRNLCVALGASLVMSLGAPASATAQFGGLSKLKGAVQKRMEPTNEHAEGPVPVKVGVVWTTEIVTNDIVPRLNALPETNMWSSKFDAYNVKAEAMRTLHGSVNAAVSTGLDALPGGPMARAMAATNPVFVMNFAGRDLTTLAGSVTHSYRVTESGAPCKVTEAMNEKVLSNPGKLAADGSQALDAANTQIIVSFHGEDPVSVQVMITPPVGVRGRASGFACGGKRPVAWLGNFSVDHDYSESAIGVGLAEVLDSQDCPFKKSRSGNVLTMTGRCERMDGGHKVVSTTTLTFDAPPPPKGDFKVAAAPAMEAGKGTITFTQNGKQATWPLNSLVNTSGPASGVTLMYTPDGATPSEERGLLALSVMHVMGQTMIGMNVAKGPAGNTAFEGEHCTGKTATIGGRTEGSGECRNGKDVVTFTFVAGK